MKAKLAALKDPLNEFKTVVDKQYGANELANRSNNLKGTLVSHRIGADVKGYDLKKPLTIPPVCVQAAYNVRVILDYVASLVNNDSFVTLGKDASDIGNALAQAIEYLTPGKGLVVDETSAKIADVCSQLFAEVGKQSGGISDMVPSVLKTDKIEKAAKKADNLAKPFMTVVSAFFEIAERGYRIKNILKDISIDPQILLTDANKNQALRQKLLSVLPKDQRTGLPDGLNVAFFEQYKIKCNQYLEKIKAIDPEPFLHPKKPPKPGSKKETLLKTAQKFSAEKTKFVGDFSAFSDRINQLAQAMKPPEPEVIVAPEPEVETQTHSPENLQTESSQTEVIVGPPAIETEAPQIVDAEIPPEIIPEPIVSETGGQKEELHQGEEELLDPISHVQKLLDKLESDKLALTQKIQTSSDQIIQLKGEIAQLGVKLENFKEGTVAPLEREITVLKDALLTEPTLAQLRTEHEELTKTIEKKPTVEQLEGQIAALEQEQPQLRELVGKITSNELSADSTMPAALGMTKERLDAYLVLQEDENSFLNQAGKVVSNFFGLFSDNPAPQHPEVNAYSQEKEKLLQRLDKKINGNQTELNVLDSEKQLAPSKLKQLHDNLNNLNTKIQVLEEKSNTLSQLTDRLASEQKKISSLESKIEDKTSQISDLNNSQNNYEAQRDQLIDQQGALKIELETLKSAQEAAQNILPEEVVIPKGVPEIKITDTTGNNEASDQKQTEKPMMSTGGAPSETDTINNLAENVRFPLGLKEELDAATARLKLAKKAFFSQINSFFKINEADEPEPTEDKIEGSFKAIIMAIHNCIKAFREYNQIKKELKKHEKTAGHDTDVSVEDSVPLVKTQSDTKVETAPLSTPPLQTLPQPERYRALLSQVSPPEDAKAIDSQKPNAPKQQLSN